MATSKRQSSSKVQGFTLLELMITLVIIAIIAGVAVTSYQDYVTRTRRTDCQGVLQNFAINMERFFSIRNTYVGSSGAVPGAPNNTVFPSQCPLDGDAKFYDLIIVEASATNYVLQATPIAASGQAGDGALQLTSAGIRRYDRNDDGDFDDARENTWER